MVLLDWAQYRGEGEVDAEFTVSSLPLLAMTKISSPIYVLTAGSDHSFLQIRI